MLGSTHGSGFLLPAAGYHGKDSFFTSQLICRWIFRSVACFEMSSFSTAIVEMQSDRKLAAPPPASQRVLFSILWLFLLMAIPLMFPVHMY